LRDLLAVRALIPALVELLLALRAELLGEDPEPARDDRRARIGPPRHSWHLGHLRHTRRWLHLASLLLLTLRLLPELLRSLKRVGTSILQILRAVDIDLDVPLDVLDREDPVLCRAKRGKDEFEVLEEHDSLVDAMASSRAVPSLPSCQAAAA